MGEFKEGDFVQVDFNIYANDKLMQTTNEKLGKKNKFEIKDFKPLIIILGKAFVLKALDEDIIKNKGKNNKLELNYENAYGRRKKELLKTFPKSTFDENKTRPIVGIAYEFGNNMYGIVKSVIGGRVLVDFNNPLSGKNIVLEYSNIKLVTKIEDKIVTVFKEILKIQADRTQFIVKDKNLILKVSEQLIGLKDQLSKSLEEIIPQIKDYKLEFQKIEIKK